MNAASATVEPGQPIVLTGRYFRDGCDDQGRGEPTPPSKNLAVTWTQGDVEVRLARVDADDDGRIRVTATFPRTASVGKAEIGVGTSTPLVVTVRKG